MRSRDNDSRYAAEIVCIKSEMAILAGEIVILRTEISSGPNVDEALRATCTQLATDHENSLSRWRESDRQLASARRE